MRQISVKCAGSVYNTGNVKCGGHMAKTCSQCLCNKQGIHQGYLLEGRRNCNGDCQWRGNHLSGVCHKRRKINKGELLSTDTTTQGCQWSCTRQCWLAYGWLTLCHCITVATYCPREQPQIKVNPTQDQDHHNHLVVDRKRNFVILQKAEREPSKDIPFCRNTERTERGSFCRNGIFLQKWVLCAGQEFFGMKNMGASIKYVRTIFWILDPLPFCPHFQYCLSAKLANFWTPHPPLVRTYLMESP